MLNGKKNILVVTSSFPRNTNDYSGIFVRNLCVKLTSHYNIVVLAPHNEASLKHEVCDGLIIYRHKQSFFSKNGIAYGSGIMPNIKKNKFLFFEIPFYFLYQFFAIKRLVKKYNIDVIHAHWLIPNALTVSIYKRFFNSKIKLITTIHGSDLLLLNNFLGRKVKKFVLENITNITVVSSALKNYLLGNYMLKKDIVVYPMGIDTKTFKNSNQSQKLTDTHSEFNLLFIGRIIELKGIDILLEAMPQVISRFPEIILTIIGEGSMRFRLERRVETLNLLKNIKFLGQKEHQELPNYYSKTDLFLFPSYSEGFGLTLAEAMACECLVLSSTIESIEDIVDNAINGFLLPELTSKAIAEAIISILTLPYSTKEKIKKAAREKIVTHFDWEIVTKNYLSLYDSHLPIS